MPGSDQKENFIITGGEVGRAIGAPQLIEGAMHMRLPSADELASST